jgi:signal transduction protein with GAF and PtsI domain
VAKTLNVAQIEPFNVNQIEGEIQDVMLQRPPRIQAVESMPKALTVPDYVSHREDATEIGKLSAEAIVREYEVTAKEIEAIGEFVREMAQRCEQLATSASAMLKDIKATAARYRKEGKRIFNEIESCSSATDEVRQLCETFRDRIVAKTTERAP